MSKGASLLKLESSQAHMLESPQCSYCSALLLLESAVMLQDNPPSPFAQTVPQNGNRQPYRLHFLRHELSHHSSHDQPEKQTGDWAMGLTQQCSSSSQLDCRTRVLSLSWVGPATPSEQSRYDKRPSQDPDHTRDSCFRTKCKKNCHVLIRNKRHPLGSWLFKLLQY